MAGGPWPVARGAALAAILAALAAGGAPAGAAGCGPRFAAPPAAPAHATQHNGWASPPACFGGPGPFHVFAIGDWGGVSDTPGAPPRPADRRARTFAAHRPFVLGIDDSAQQRVAAQMRARATVHEPDFVLNVGDNFYWGGVKSMCGAGPAAQVDTGQWGPIFEHMYVGPGIDGKQWLGVLGNHDYGGYKFTSAWDQSIYYTWGGNPQYWTNRWMTPAQYWSATAKYPDFTVDFYFLDSNVFDTFEPQLYPNSNICGLEHNGNNATCGAEGPISVWDCHHWFQNLWQEQMRWFSSLLERSTAEWQVVVTHFPPSFGAADWQRLVEVHGIDVIISGHHHMQEVHHQEADNFLRPTAWVISGGGGGITSEALPSKDGADDQYGFVDLSLTKEEITIEVISHGGQLRSTTRVTPRLSAEQAKAVAAGEAAARVAIAEAKAKAAKEAASNATIGAPTTERAEGGGNQSGHLGGEHTSTTARGGNHRSYPGGELTSTTVGGGNHSGHPGGERTSTTVGGGNHSGRLGGERTSTTVGGGNRSGNNGGEKTSTTHEGRHDGWRRQQEEQAPAGRTSASVLTDAGGMGGSTGRAARLREAAGDPAGTAGSRRPAGVGSTVSASAGKVAVAAADARSAAGGEARTWAFAIAAAAVGFVLLIGMACGTSGLWAAGSSGRWSCRTILCLEGEKATAVKVHKRRALQEVPQDSYVHAGGRNNGDNIVIEGAVQDRSSSPPCVLRSESQTGILQYEF